MLILKWLSSLLDPEDTPRSAVAAREAGTYLSKPNGSDDAMDAYYSTMDSLQRAISNREYPRATGLVLENLELIPPWVRRTKREFGDVPPTIPALEKGGTILVITGHRAGLDRMQQVVSQIPELSKRNLPTTLRHFPVQFSDPSFPPWAGSAPSTAVTGSARLIQTSTGSSGALGGPPTKRSGRAA